MAAKDSRMEVQEIYSEAEESYSAPDSDDTESDPDYDIIEDAQSKLSNLSIGKKGKARVVEGEGPPMEIDPEEVELTAPGLDEKDEKIFEKVQKIIEAGELEKLKVLECKLYLRKNGLRLTGNKDTLIQRIREHLEIINGGGERKYPPSSFVLNCKGDACTGDVVLFEQNVYEMFSIASRSASGPPCGKRTVAGRIVKESYGAAKQQHTFTIEVLWSKGEKPLPPLYPLLIKGRNLYRLKTLRQRWYDEGERQKKLMEKHSRGNVARVNREARIQEKEKRKLIRENRVSNKESSSIQSQSHPLMTESQYPPPGSINPARPEIFNSHNHQALKRPIDRSNPYDIDHTRRDKFSENHYGPNIHSREKQIPLFRVSNKESSSIQSQSHPLMTESQYPTPGSINPERPEIFNSHNHQALKRPIDRSNHYDIDHTRRDKFIENYYGPNIHSREKQIPVEYRPHPYIPDRYAEWPHHRRPLTSANHLHPLTQNREPYEQKQLCRYHAQGRWCPFGDNCKFSHDLREQKNRMQIYAHRH